MSHAATTEKRRARPYGVRVDRERFPCIDGYRGIAAMSVLVFHVGAATGFIFRKHPLNSSLLLSRLDVGVAIFFVVSGFLLYRPFVVAHFERHPQPSLRAYTRGRLLRILPAYWFALTLIAFAFNLAPGVKSVRGFPIFYGLAQIYVPGYGLGGLGQTWSLATELSFYAFLPIYAWLVSRRPRSPRRQLRVELAAAVTLYASSVTFRIFVSTFFPKRFELNYWLFAMNDLFALGIALAILSAWYAHLGRQPQLVRHHALPASSWAVAAVSFWIVARIVGQVHSPFGLVDLNVSLSRQALYGVVAVSLLLPGVFGPQQRGLIRKFLQSRIMRLLGLVSYGVFLWHIFAIKELIRVMDARVDADWMLRTPSGHLVAVPPFLIAVVAASLGLAAISYVLVERPFLRLKHRSSTRQ